MPKVPEDKTLIIPKDELYSDLYFTMQGFYFHHNVNDWKENHMTVYEDKEFTKPLFSIASGLITISNSKIQCFKSEGKWTYWGESNQSTPCPVEFDVTVIDESTKNSSDVHYYYRVIEIDLERKYVTISQNEKIYYIPLNDCTGINSCNFVYYPETRYQNDLNRLAAYKKNEDFIPLNDLRQFLLPCLEKKDVNCIKKYIVQPEDIYKSGEEECIDSSISIPSYSFSNEDIEELKECLKYENLMVHLLGMKGNKKYCIIAPHHTLKEGIEDTKILSVGSHEDIERSYRNYDYEPPVVVPPMTLGEVEIIKERLK